MLAESDGSREAVHLAIYRCDMGIREAEAIQEIVE